MNQNSYEIKRYAQRIREKLEAIDLESDSSNELVVALDNLLPLLERLKARLYKKSKAKEPRGLNLKELLDSVHNATDNGVCGECYFEIDSSLSVCPFCGSIFSDAELEEHIPSITPITTKSLGNSLQPKKKRGRPAGYTKSTKLATRLVNWLRKQEFSKRIPYSVDDLNRIKTNDIRTIASLFPQYTVEEFRHYKKEDYIRFILANQNSGVDIGPCPVDCSPELISS